MSYSWANLKKTDPRVQQVLKWVRDNYTVDENPGLGQKTVYYYYMVFAKALQAVGESTITDAKGRRHNWREDLGKKLISLARCGKNASRSPNVCRPRGTVPPRARSSARQARRHSITRRLYPILAAPDFSAWTKLWQTTMLYPAGRGTVRTRRGKKSIRRA